MAYLWLILSGACSVVASVALKAAGSAAAHGPTPSLLTQALPYAGAIGAYGLGFGFYALAYPLMVACAIAGVFVYGLLSGTETITAMRMAGAAFIAVGVFLVSK